jgi:hypothetical protein
MAPLDKKWFTGSGDLPGIVTDNLLVASLGQPVNATLGRNGWDGRTVAGVGLELSPDNTTVRRSQFYMRGNLSQEPGIFQASKLWEKASKDISVKIVFPTAGEFEFAGGSMASEYLDADMVKIQCEKDGQPVPVADWPRYGIKTFVMRLVAYLDKMSNKTGPKIKYTLLFYPETVDEMLKIGDEVQGPAWPGIKVLEGQADFFPLAPERAWGCPIYPMLAPGGGERPSRVPSGDQLRYAIAKVLGTARLPVPCTSAATLRKKWQKIEEDQEQYEERIPTVTWPEVDEPEVDTGKWKQRVLFEYVRGEKHKTVHFINTMKGSYVSRCFTDS